MSDVDPFIVKLPHTRCASSHDIISASTSKVEQDRRPHSGMVMAKLNSGEGNLPNLSTCQENPEQCTEVVH